MNALMTSANGLEERENLETEILEHFSPVAVWDALVAPHVLLFLPFPTFLCWRPLWLFMRESAGRLTEAGDPLKGVRGERQAFCHIVDPEAPLFST